MTELIMLYYVLIRFVLFADIIQRTIHVHTHRAMLSAWSSYDMQPRERADNKGSETVAFVIVG